MAHRYDPATVDAVLDALGNARRRYALYYIHERDDVAVDDLTATVTDWLEAGSENESGGTRGQERIRVSLFHTDLPKLSEVGLVSVDHQNGTVSFEGTAVDEALLDVLFAHERIFGETDPAGTLYRGV